MKFPRSTPRRSRSRLGGCHALLGYEQPELQSFRDEVARPDQRCVQVISRRHRRRPDLIDVQLLQRRLRLHLSQLGFRCGHRRLPYGADLELRLYVGESRPRELEPQRDQCQVRLGALEQQRVTLRVLTDLSEARPAVVPAASVPRRIAANRKRANERSRRYSRTISPSRKSRNSGLAGA